MSTLMTLVAPEKMRIKASKLRVKKTPFSAKVSFKSNSGIQTRKLVKQMKNMQIFSATNGIRLAKPLPSRKQKLLQRRSLLLGEIALPT